MTGSGEGEGVPTFAQFRREQAAAIEPIDLAGVEVGLDHAARDGGEAQPRNDSE